MSRAGRATRDTRPPRAPHAVGVGDTRHVLAGWVLIVMLVAVAYGPVYSAGFIWDDDDYVTANPTLRNAAGLLRAWTVPGAVPQYYPLVHTTFWLEYRLWGLDPRGYHAVNVALHAAAACVLWRLLRRLEVSGAWLAAGLFAIHPVHVESVAWITERKNVLSALLYLLAFLAYLRFHPMDAERPTGGRRRWALATSLFVAALLAKTVAASLPAAILVVRWWKTGRLRRADAAPLVPWFLFGLALGSLTSWLERHHVGASGDDWALSWHERWIVAGRAVWFYLGKLVWPTQLTFNYPRWTIDASELGAHAAPLAAIAAVGLLWVGRRRLGRGPVTAALFFGGTLLPALGVFDVYPMRYAFVADHFQYLASLGPIALVAALAARVGTGPVADRIRPVAAASALAVLSILTWRQARVYHDAETLWRDTLAKNPASSLAHNNLGVILRERGDVAAAAAHYRRAFEADPRNYEAMNNLANLLQGRGLRDEAVRLYERALAIQPNSASALNGLGVVDSERGDLARAEARFRRAIAARPDLSAAHFNLGNALARQGRVAEAVTAYRTGLRLEPSNALVHLNLGTALLQGGRPDEALAAFEEARRLDPGLTPAKRAIEALRGPGASPGGRE